MHGHFVHPFDDDLFIAGNGTAGLEILEDLPDVDTIVAPIGGGGLLAGIAAAARALKPDVKIFAAEPETAAPLATSLARGRARAISKAGRPRLSTARAANRCCPRCGRCCSPLVDGSIVVSLDEVKPR